MTQPLISLAMIVRDEESNLAQCLESVAPHVDEIIIVDTGSTDRTREVAVRYGASVYQFDAKNHPEAFYVDDAATCAAFGAPEPFSGDIALGDFAAARNESFRRAAGEFIFWMDADDVLDGGAGLRGIAQEMKDRNGEMSYLPYDYARDDKGRTQYRQWRERIFRRGLGVWVNPIHEVYMPGQPVQIQGKYETPKLVHLRKADRKVIPNRNYKNLLRQAWQVKNAGGQLDPRILFYLGQESKYIEPKRSLGFFQEYLRSSGWPEERGAAHIAIGDMLEFGRLSLSAEESFEQANREYATAAMEMPGNPDGIFGLARISYLRGRWIDCINYTERAFQVGNTDSMLGANPLDRIYRPHFYYNHALANVGRLEDAIASCRAGLMVCPDDPGIPGGAPGMLKFNLAVYEADLAKRRAAAPAPSGLRQDALINKNEDVDAPPNPAIPRDALIIWALQLWKQNIAAGDISRAALLIDSIPPSLLSDPVLDRMKASTARRFVPPEPVGPPGDVVLFLGPGVEPWAPTTPATSGLGGSETAAIEMAKNLAAQGRQVKVFAEATGTFDGVEYIHHSKFRGARCAVFIASRVPWAIDRFGPVDAKLKLLWAHDIHCGPRSAAMERRLYKFDRVLCLSEWHKGFFVTTYPTLHPDRIIVTRNGIDPTRFQGDAFSHCVKENRLVFSSSPNRGLPMLLASMGEIRKTVPDAHVDIFYGFDTWETMMKAQGNQPELDEIAKYKQMIGDAVTAGIATFHGRRPQPELAAAFMRSKVWGYPTEFQETSCISAMEAQAAGCVPVTTRYAALGETVKCGVLLDPGPDYQSHFIAEVVRMLSDEAYRAPIADAGRKWALENLSWAALAADWIAMFDRLTAEVEANPVPQWKAA